MGAWEGRQGHQGLWFLKPVPDVADVPVVPFTNLLYIQGTGAVFFIILLLLIGITTLHLT